MHEKQLAELIITAQRIHFENKDSEDTELTHMECANQACEKLGHDSFVWAWLVYILNKYHEKEILSWAHIRLENLVMRKT